MLNMINLRILLRQPVLDFLKPKVLVSNFNTGKSSSSSSSDDEKTKNPRKRRSDEALEKLNTLLSKMIQDTDSTRQRPKLDLAKAVDHRKKDAKPKTEDEKKVDPVQEMVTAVKEVAKVVSGNIKQTESELLQKLLNPVKEESVPTSTANNLSEIFKDMKIDRETKPTGTVSRAQQVRQILQNVASKHQPDRTNVVARKAFKRPSSFEQTEDQIIEERVTLFGNETLGIFPSAAEISAWPKQDLNKTWNALEERELRLAVTHPPANYFQQMIHWTEQGKIWRFPIDNEQDMDAEKSVDFTEHVFLEKHIESWCPPKGPIRHFMELVLVGLSKNPYLSVEHKKEHIEWFKNYFNEKKALLQEVEAIPADFQFIKEHTRKIEP